MQCNFHRLAVLFFSGVLLLHALAVSDAQPHIQRHRWEMLVPLAERLGALQSIEQRCRGTASSRWREIMQRLIDVEDNTSQQKSQLKSHFNRGYETTALLQTSCDKKTHALYQKYLFSVQENVTRMIKKGY